jgi:hypothetical protein
MAHKRTIVSWSGAAVGAAVAAVAIGACAENRRSYRAHLTDTGNAALHAVQNEKLRELMGNLNRQVPEEWGITMERERWLKDMERVAGEMAQSAGAIPTAMAGAKMEEGERQIFVSLAEKLKTQSLELQQLAQKKEIDQAERKLDGIIGTCNACHSAFRVLPGAAGS